MLMEHFAGVFSGVELCRLNQCRQFLRVVRVSDIVSGDGRRILEDAWKGKAAGNWMGTDNFVWPRKPPISNSAKHWSVWRKAIGKLCGNQRKTLREPLGRWYADEEWEWFVDPTNDSLYQVIDGQWRTFRPLWRTASTRAAILRFEKDPILTAKPTCALHAVVQELPAVLLVTFYGQAVPRPANPVPAGLALFVPTESAWVLQHVGLPNDGGEFLAECIRDGTIKCVSDGSEKKGIGTAAFVLCGGDKENRLIGACIVPGAENDQSSTRSEQMGLYALGLTMLAIVKKFDIQEGSATMGCDGKISLSSTFRQKDFDAEKKNFDLIGATKNVMKATGIR